MFTLTRITRNKPPIVHYKPPPLNKLTLYYRLTDKDTHISNASATTFVTNPSDPDIYRGIENRFMCNKSYSTNTSDIITFVGYRTPANEALGLPRLYKEVVSINSKPYQNNFIEAVANYVDNGNGFATELKFVNYTVTAASGKFKGFTNIRINFYSNGTRVVDITR